jgi:hypothetical protein
MLIFTIPICSFLTKFFSASLILEESNLSLNFASNPLAKIDELGNTLDNIPELFSEAEELTGNETGWSTGVFVDLANGEPAKNKKATKPAITPAAT